MREIDKAIEYLNKVSVKKPIEIRVEEVELNRIVISFRDEADYMWQNDRRLKEFIFENGEVIKMMNFAPNQPNKNL